MRFNRSVLDLAAQARLRCPSAARVLPLSLLIALTGACNRRGATPPAAPAPVAPLAVTLVDVARQAGLTVRQTTGATGKRYILETLGSGACWFDYDADGWMDLYLVQNGPLPNAPGYGVGGNRLFRNRGDGTFEDVTARAGVPGRGYGHGCTSADFDNDGFPDLFVTGYGRNLLYRNNGNGTFTDVSHRAGLDEPAGWSTSAAFGDYDGDGYVDLYVSHYARYRLGQDPPCPLAPGVLSYCTPTHFEGESGRLYRNTGRGTFSDVTQAAGVYNADGKNLAVIWSDLDGDGKPDLIVANDNRRNLYFHNRGNGTFAEEALQAGMALGEDGRAMAGMGVDTADYDNDGHLDLSITNYADEPNELWHNEGNGAFTDVTFPANVGPPSLPRLSFGICFVDLDLDGWTDLVTANGHVMDNIGRVRKDATFPQSLLLYHNLHNGTFADQSAKVGPDFVRPRVGRGLCVADFDNDGDPDLLETALNNPPALLRNEPQRKAHWFGVRCVGASSNRDALGARVTLWAGGLRRSAEVRSASSYLSQSDPRLLFGLGDVNTVERLEIRWPSGARTEKRNLPVDQYLVVTEER